MLSIKQKRRQSEELIKLAVNDLEYLKERLNYDRNTGLFYWRSHSEHQYTGRLAGHINADGYRMIRVLKKKTYGQHRLAWAFINGNWPIGEIDHINGDRTDNRIENLRVVSDRENAQNRSAHRNGKLVGSYYDSKRNKWRGRITIAGIVRYLGSFDSAEEAHKAYQAALKESWKYV